MIPVEEQPPRDISSAASPSTGPVDNADGSTTIPVTVNPPTPPAPGTVIAPTDPVLPWEDTVEADAKFVLGKYNKFLVALGGASVSYLLQRYGGSEIVKDVVYALTVGGVWQVPNIKE